MNEQTLTVAAFNEGIRQLAPSSRDLAARFGQVRTVEGQMRLVYEEMREYEAATEDQHRMEELCDLIVVCSGLQDVWGIEAADPTRFVRHFTLHHWWNTTTYFERAHWWVCHVWMEIRFIPNAAELFPAAVARVVAKNAAKTTDTHYLDSATGKITRKAAQS